MRTIKIYSGIAEEYEIIRTDAPNQVIEEQLKRIFLSGKRRHKQSKS